MAKRKFKFNAIQLITRNIDQGENVFGDDCNQWVSVQLVRHVSVILVSRLVIGKDQLILKHTDDLLPNSYSTDSLFSLFRNFKFSILKRLTR